MNLWYLKINPVDSIRAEWTNTHNKVSYKHDESVRNLIWKLSWKLKEVQDIVFIMNLKFLKYRSITSASDTNQSKILGILVA